MNNGDLAAGAFLLPTNGMVISGITAANAAFGLLLTDAGVLDTTYSPTGEIQFTPFAVNLPLGGCFLPNGKLAATGGGYNDGVAYSFLMIVSDLAGNLDSYFFIPSQSSQAGIASFQIPTGKSWQGTAVGYQATNNTLIVAGSAASTGTTSPNFGILFYYVGG